MTSEFDIENGIKDCDVVINLVGQPAVIKDDFDYELPNIRVAREIAKVASRMRKEQKVKRFFHFSAAGANPDAISRRLRTKWQGEQEVRKYFPEATILRPTEILTDRNISNFLSYYTHCWENNNGTVLLLDNGTCLRQPVLDQDVGMALYNMLMMDETIGQTYELGGPQTYTFKELMEFYSNCSKHRPRYYTLSYKDFMKINLAPNHYFEKQVNWIISRPDLLAELRTDITVNAKQKGIKTFDDVHIQPVSTHHIIQYWADFASNKVLQEKGYRRDPDEQDVDAEDGNE